MRGEPVSQDPDNRAREIRFLQGYVLKFVHFSKATNVKSDTWNNEFTATVTTALAEVLERRGDVISVTVLGTISEKIEKKKISTHQGRKSNPIQRYRFSNVDSNNR